MKLKKLVNNIIKEQSSAAVGGHFGRGGKHGMEVDDIFAGGFHANDNVVQNLETQVDDRKRKRKDMTNDVGDEHVGIDHPVGGYFDLNTDALVNTYDHMMAMYDLRKKFNAKVTPVLDQNWKFIDSGYLNDVVEKNKEEFDEHKKHLSKFISDENDWKVIYNDNYEQQYNSRDNLKKFINDTGDWKIIYGDNK